MLRFLRLAMLAVLVSLPVTVSMEETSTSKPNLVIMMMDDMGWGDLGINGEPNRETPNLDKMAAEGMLLPDFYASNPICSPSRASTMTGTLPIRNGFYSDNHLGRNSWATGNCVGGIRDYEVLLPEILGQNGYRSKIVGKWHLGHQERYLPLNHGFDEFYGCTNSHTGPHDDKNSPNFPMFRDSQMMGRLFEGEFNIKDGEANLTQYYITEAVNFLEKQVKKKEPFFLYWAADATHLPLYASKKFLNTSPRGRYGDAMRELDFGVGQILNTLKRLGIANNTLVFFSSDNGAATYAKKSGGNNGPFLCGKETTFEGGMREPTLAWWPGHIQAGSISRQVGSLMDFYLTFLDVAGIPSYANITYDGISVKDALLSNKIVERPIFFYRGNLLMAVRLGQYKAHLWTFTNSQKSYDQGNDFCPGQEVKGVTTHNQTDHSKKPLLFDLGSDPGEKYPINPNSKEYKSVMPNIENAVKRHRASLVPGIPQMNWCDRAEESWSPPGCEKIGKCLPVPPSHKVKCGWPF